MVHGTWFVADRETGNWKPETGGEIGLTRIWKQETRGIVVNLLQLAINLLEFAVNLVFKGIRSPLQFLVSSFQ